jgi:hypothetical protein
MFSTPKSLQKRTGKSDVDRPTYLKQLVDEYQNTSTQIEKKIQVLANLGNFAYDPINYEYFRRFNVIDLFLEILNQFSSVNKLSEDELTQISFSLGAICNLCLDKKNKDYLIKNNLLKMVINYLIKLKETNELIVLNCLMILIFLIDIEDEAHNEILNNKTFIDEVSLMTESKDKRLSNLAFVFLHDFVQKV